jgi:hypothetical protein
MARESRRVQPVLRLSFQRPPSISNLAMTFGRQNRRPVFRRREPRGGAGSTALGLPAGTAQGRTGHYFRSEGRRFPKGRCLIPAPHFFEFTGTKAPRSKWKFTKAGEDWYCFAGLWRGTPPSSRARSRRNGATVPKLPFVSPSSISGRDHSARDLALSPLHAELPRRGGTASRAWALLEMLDNSETEDKVIGDEQAHGGYEPTGRCHWLARQSEEHRTLITSWLGAN